MKKLLIFLLLIFGATTFAQTDLSKIKLEELFNATHDEIIKMFGIPDFLSPTNSVSYSTNDSPNKIFFDLHDIEFIYSKDLTITFDNPMALVLTALEHKINLPDKAKKLHVCGIQLRNIDNYRLPLNLNKDDSLADIIKKLGNPDTYSKYKITYSFPVKNEKQDKRALPKSFNSSATDFVEIEFSDDKISLIRITRKHNFEFNFK